MFMRLFTARVASIRRRDVYAGLAGQILAAA